MKLNRKWIMIIALLMSLTMATAGTLAYLADTDADVNVMTLGSVYIVQNESQRVVNADGTYATDTIDGQTSYVLEEYKNDKPLMPIVGDPSKSRAAGWDAIPVRMTQIGSYGSMQVFAGKNAVDKFVTVTNTGKSDAYVRTYVAIEAGSTDGSLIGTSYHNAWTKTQLEDTVSINNNNYVVLQFDYPGAQLSDGTYRHENGILPAGDTTYPSLCQVYLKSEANNEDMVAIDGNGNGKLDILVLSQAVQTNGFDNAAEALEAAFNPDGDPIADKVAEWLTNPVVGSPGEKNETNNPPVIMPTTSWADNADTTWFDAAATTYEIDTAAKLAGFAKMVNEEKVTFSGKTVKLAANINLGANLWIPVGQTGATEFKGVFDGNGKTISNLYIDSTAQIGANYSSGLFGWLENHGSGITVKDLTINGAVVKGNHNTGVIAGYVYGTIENCTVKNAEVTCTHANDDACGDKAGIIAGYAGDGYFTNNKAIDCTVTAGRDAGQLFGCIIKSQQKNFVGNTAENVVVSATGDCTGANIKNEIFGRIP